MITLTPEASTRLKALERFYIEIEWPQALRNLDYALANASLVVVNAPQGGPSPPRPHPELSTPGFSLLKRGRYCIAYDPARPIIAGVFLDTDRLLTRLR